MPVEIPVEKWSGRIREVTLGGDGRKKVTIGGASALPFLHFEGEYPNRTAVGIEIHDRPPTDWSQPLMEVWGDVMGDVAAWAKRAVEYGAEVIALHLKSAHPEDANTGAAEATRTVGNVLAAVDVPLIVIGPYVADKDNEVLVAASDVAKGQRIAMGYCEEKNYRTIAVSCVANGHVAIAKTPIEINLAKQLNILVSDMGVPLDSIIMDTTTGALGYGLEYCYSVAERLRLAALQGDGMASMPIYNSVGEEAWRQKEARFAEGVPETWGNMAERALFWEQTTAIGILQAGSDLIVLRHPKTVETIKATIDKLMAK